MRVKFPVFLAIPRPRYVNGSEALLVSAFHPEGLAPVPNTRGAGITALAWPLVEARRERDGPYGHADRSPAH